MTSRKGKRCAGAGALSAMAERAAPAMLVLACVLMGSPAMADPTRFDPDASRLTDATFARRRATLAIAEGEREGSLRDAWRSLAMRARLASGGDGERVCRPDPRPFNRRAPELCRPIGGLASVLAVATTELNRRGGTSEVEIYLCDVYWRMPHKIDDAGDFSWKDAAAAERVERSVCDYAINGMHPDLREALYVLGRKLDEAGIHWSILSAFRDDYRQSIASGFKAPTCGSWHGGSCKTNGWGDGRAADLWIADANGYPAEDASALFALVDKHAHALGLARPLPGADPPHVQLGGGWQEAARKLREQRLHAAPKEVEQTVSAP
jgi:hypothetical protein